MQELSSRVEISPFWSSKCLSTFSVPLIYPSPACQTSFSVGEGDSLFLISRDSQSQFCSLLSLSWWYLELTPSHLVSLQDLKREKEKTVYFVLQTIIKCSGRVRQESSWLSIGIASSFCRIIESFLCKWRLPWNLSHHFSHPVGSPFQKMTLYSLSLESPVRIYCIQNTVKHPSLCVCVKQNYQVLFFTSEHYMQI